MGRTIQTYRTRLNASKSKFRTLLKLFLPHLKQQRMWAAAHYLSAPASTVPVSDDNIVTLFSILLDLHKSLDDLENEIGDRTKDV